MVSRKDKDSIPEPIRPMCDLGLDISPAKKAGRQLFTDCPFCGKADKFYVNTDNGQWDCKHCDKKGNIYSFLKYWYDMYLADQDAKADRDAWVALANNRQLDPDVMKSEGIVYDGERFYIPFKNLQSRIVNFQHFSVGSGKTIWLSNPLKAEIFGAEQFAGKDEDSTVYLVEGPWDAIALRFLLEKEGQQGRVYGVPGAKVWKDAWNELIEGKDVVCLYDNDTAGEMGVGVVYKRIKSKVKSFKAIKWPVDMPDKFDIRDFVTKDGTFDLLMEMVGPYISLEEREEQARGENTKKVPINSPKRPTFESVLDVYRKHLHMTQDLEDALKIIFATILSTRIKGDPLWVHLIAPPGGGKCLAKDTPILMFNGTIKMVQDIKVGDRLMGPDSKPRKVKSLATGKEKMYRVTPVKGNSYSVNESHILSLKNTDTKEIVDISVKDYLNKNNWFRERHKGYRTGVDFPHREVMLDPYFLGVWLGDGSNSNQIINNPDSEVKAYVKQYAKRLGLTFSDYVQEGKCPRYAIVDRKGKSNEIRELLSGYGVRNNKHIPLEFKVNSREVRLQVLAGIIDTDGHLTGRGCYDLIFKEKQLADDVVYIARSLGLAAYTNQQYKENTTTGKGDMYNRVCISGNIDQIPCLVERKKAGPRKQIKDVLVTGIKVEPVGIGRYYGFEIDSDGRFLLGDFTVTHNTILLMSTALCSTCYPISSLTPNTLVSGYGGANNDPSLLPKLEGKTLIIKDYTEILDMPKLNKDVIFGQLRGAYDGEVIKPYGNNIERKYKSHFNVLTGVTQAIYAERSASLGERFLMFHVIKGVGFDSSQSIMSAIENVGKEAGINEELTAAARDFLEVTVNEEDVPEVPEHMKLRLVSLAQLVAMLRATVERDIRTRNLLSRPQHEVGTRLAKQFTKLLKGCGLVNTPAKITEDDYRIASRIAIDTCVGFNLEALASLVEKGGQTIVELSEDCNLPISTLKDQVEDLVELGAVRIEKIEPKEGQRGRPMHKYHATKRLRELWNGSELVRENGQVKFLSRERRRLKVRALVKRQPKMR